MDDMLLSGVQRSAEPDSEMTTNPGTSSELGTLQWTPLNKDDSKRVLTLDHIVNDLEDVDRSGGGKNPYLLDYKRMLIAVAIWLESKQLQVGQWEELFKQNHHRAALEWKTIKGHYWLTSKWDEKNAFMREYRSHFQNVEHENFRKHYYGGVPANIGRYMSIECYKPIMSAFCYKVYAILRGNPKDLPKPIKNRALEVIDSRVGNWKGTLQLPFFMNVLSFTNGVTYAAEGPLDQQGSDYLTMLKRDTLPVNKGGRPSYVSQKSVKRVKSRQVSSGDESDDEESQRSKRHCSQVTFADDWSLESEEEKEDLEVNDEEAGGPEPLIGSSKVLKKVLEEKRAHLSNKEFEREKHLEKISILDAELEECKSNARNLREDLKLAKVSEDGDEYFKRRYGTQDAKAIVGQSKQMLVDFSEDNDAVNLIRKACSLFGVEEKAALQTAVDAAKAHSNPASDNDNAPAPLSQNDLAVATHHNPFHLDEATQRRFNEILASGDMSFDVLSAFEGLPSDGLPEDYDELCSMSGSRVGESISSGSNANDFDGVFSHLVNVGSKAIAAQSSHAKLASQALSGNQMAGSSTTPTTTASGMRSIGLTRRKLKSSTYMNIGPENVEWSD